MVLPRIGNTSLVLATLVALQRFRARFADLVAEYAYTEFREGDIVRVNPSNLVYEYAGFFDRPGRRFFKLRILGTKEGDARACEAGEILRLQRAEGRTPRGKVNSDLGELAATSLDRLLGVRTLGNTAILRNEVILHSNRATFESFLQNVCADVGPADECHTDTYTASLGDVLPWGTVAEDGTLRMESATDGYPLCAVTYQPYRIRAAAELLPPDSTLVIVDGARRVSDTGTLLATADRQRVLVLADIAEIEHIDALQRAGATVWQPDASEIIAGNDLSPERRGVAGELLRAAGVLRDLRFEAVPVRGSVLDEVAAHLRQAESATDDDTDQSARQAIGDCFNLLLELGTWCIAPAPDVADTAVERARGIADRLHLIAHFLPASINAPIDRGLAGLRGFISDHRTTPTPKLEALSTVLNHLEEAGERSIVLVRSAASAHGLSGYVNERWQLPVVLSGRAVPPDLTYSTVILAGWPGKELLGHVVGRLRAPIVRLVGYEYEQLWMKGYERRRLGLARAWRIDGEDRTRKLGLPPTRVPRVAETVHLPDHSLDALLSAMRLDGMRAGARKGAGVAEIPESDVREGKYVSFYGDTYAYLTESHTLPRLNAMVGDDTHQRRTVGQVVVDELRPGDFVLFRDVGESDVISLIAQEMYGEQYTKARRLAETWRPVLRSIASDRDTIFRRLRRHGLKRQAATVYSWLNDPSRIGPQDEEDLCVIANTARNLALLREARSVFEAIRYVRGAHLSAGTKLTQLLLAELPDKLDRVDGEETEVHLTFGTAWIVQVEEVAREFEPRSYMEVNRLLRDDRHT